MIPDISPFLDPGPGMTAFLASLGYPEDLLRFNYPVWLGPTVSRLPVVGFGRRAPQDMTTATLVAARSTDGAIEGLFTAARTLAAPVVILNRDNQVEIWAVPSEPGTEHQVNTAPEEDVTRLAEIYHSELDPNSLFSAKSMHRQLSLFPVDVDLLATARRDLFTQLMTRVKEAAILSTSPLPKDKRLREDRLIAGSQAVVGALAALMMRDKFGLSANGLELFDQARQLYPNYFNSLTPTLSSIQTLPQILEILGEGINYEALDPRIVSLVYEEAIVDESERLRSGIFYTPTQLAVRMLAHLPIEELAPEDRIILDPACGSGTLLLAAHDRLQDLTPVQWERDEMHTYVTRQLHGIDRDQFAVDIARLALLLHALPEGNRWDVSRRDSLATQLEPRQRPTVIVSNPPWKDIRSAGGRRHQVADDFLRWTLEALRPGGFFAILMPSSWLTSTTSGSLREIVQEKATVFEVWRLPDNAFTSARTAPCVLFGQTGTRTSRPWVFRRVLRRSNTENFYRTGIADEIHLAVEAKAARSGTYLRGPLDEAAPILNSMPTLESIATIQSGPVPEPPVSSRGGSGDFLWLKNAGDFQAFSTIDRSKLSRARFPEDFHRAGKHDGSIFLRPKLVISADRWPVNPWRLKVGVDTIGVIPRDSLHMVIPHQPDDQTIDALLAILGSAVASCWVDSYQTKLAIDTRLIRELPIPPPGPAWAVLANAGRRMRDASESPALAAVRAQELDAIVFQAYGLPQRVIRSLATHFGGFPAPEGSVRYPAPAAPATTDAPHTRTFGAVLDVEPEGKLRLWVPGATPDEGITEPVPQRFLGWHCVEGATFEIDMGTSLGRASFAFQRRSYQDFDAYLDGTPEISDHK